MGEPRTGASILQLEGLQGSCAATRQGHEGEPRLCGGDWEIGRPGILVRHARNLTTQRKPQAVLRLSIFPISRDAEIDAKGHSRRFPAWSADVRSAPNSDQKADIG